MKRCLPPLIFVLIVACHSLPPLLPSEQEAADLAAACQAVFPRHAWRMVHTITTDFSGGRKGVMLGVVSLSPAEGIIECALLSIEGLRLFEARDDGTLTVRRALPPFDRPALAEGMMQDIRLLFFAPESPPVISGLRADGNPGCRFALSVGFLDVISTPEGGVLLERFDQRQRLIRRVAMTRCRPKGVDGEEAIPCRIHLEAMGSNAYRLDLDLVEAHPAVDSPG